MHEGNEGQKQVKKPKDDILNIVKQFISYFEEADRSERDDHQIKHNSIKHS